MKADESGPGPVGGAFGGRLRGGGKSKRPGGVPDRDRRNSTGMPDAFPSQCASGFGREVQILPRQERLRDVKIFSPPRRCPPNAPPTGPGPLSVLHRRLRGVRAVGFWMEIIGIACGKVPQMLHPSTTYYCRFLLPPALLSALYKRLREYSRLIFDRMVIYDYFAGENAIIGCA